MGALHEVYGFTGMTELGIAMDGRAPIADIPAQARAAEEGGASTPWIACHLFLRDPITTAALALGATSRIKIALMAMSPYSVHPVFTAMAAASARRDVSRAGDPEPRRGCAGRPQSRRPRSAVKPLMT